ncbi:AarF/ABC1/UbiB kinase family protein [Novosphingobium profundi]|uniref:ABC1 kinase family protein n=1 Tax=Novosphingobium profundi TaxID=1774954 RepID=UPI001BDB530F|nr:AarF/UbiB family protein [Novosphingobium profundi]MBT0666920.1 AarF/ABC1/UbiB kinase family protein [Novosphingobium profundi]
MFEVMTMGPRDRARWGEITAVIARFGLEALAVRLGLGEGKRSDGDSASERDLPSRTRRALEALGPTFVKFGQILATRRDLLSDEWIAAFERLQDEAPTLPFEDLRGQVEAALGAPPEEVFDEFDPQPLAAASMAQVHRARLADGTEVAVKIRRPGIAARMEADMRILRRLAGLAEARSPALRRLAPRPMIEQLGRDILEELDFTQEARNAERLREDLTDLARVTVPRIHWAHTGPDLLVMDFIEGTPPRSAQALRAKGIDPEAIAALGAELVLEMVLVNGRFHADPHPGNLLCLAPDRLALIDLGSVGTIAPRRSHEFLTFILALRAGDPAGVADTLALWSQTGDVSRERLMVAAERLVARHSTGPLVLSAMVADFFPLLREEGLVLPPDLVLIFKAMVTMDGVLSGIAPGFDLSEALGAMRLRLITHRLSGLARPERGEALLLELARVADQAPRLMRAASARLERGEEAPPGEEATARAVRRAGALVGAALVAHALIGVVARLVG